MSKTIELKKEEIKVLGKTITYYLTKASKKACEQIEENKDLLKKGVNNPDAILIAVGDGMKKPRGIDKTLFSFECNTNGEYQTHFKNYQVSLEYQKRLANQVNMCIDPKMSWQSALRAIGYNSVSGLNTPAHTTAYCLVWKIES